MFKAVTRKLGVCSKWVHRPLPSRRSWLTTAQHISYQDSKTLPADHSPPGAKQDDAILRELFDAPRRSRSIWRTATARQSVGLFKNRYLTTPGGFLVFATASLEKAQRIVSRVLSASTEAEYRSIVKNLDRLSDLLCRVLDLSDFVRMTHPDPQFQGAAAEAWALVYEYMNRLNTMTGLYDQLRVAMGKPEVVRYWSEEERTVAAILDLDFAKSGVGLTKRARDRFVDLSQKISEVGSRFVSDMAPEQSSIVFPSSKLFGLYPEAVRGMTKKGGVELPTVGSESAAALRSVHDADTRKAIYIASRKASSPTIRMLETMLKLRAELAGLVGFESYGDLALKDRMMAKTPSSVTQFLSALQQRNRRGVQEDYEAMLQRKKAILRTTETEVQPWDRDYLMEKIRTEMRLRTRQPDSLSAYFSVGTVLQGLSRLFSRLYGVRFVPRETQAGETWHEDVRRLDVMTDTGEQIAVLYCDLFFRNGKSPNPAHFTVRCSREISPDEIQEASSDLHAMGNILKFASAEQAANDGMECSTSGGVLKQLPTIALVCDFPQSAGDASPALLTFFQVETLFHEMGHAIHSVLARTSLQNVAGTRCATDFAELPSTLMEHFAADPSVLRLFARHWKTDEPLDYEMVAERISVAKRFEASDTEHQIMLAMLDQAYHSPQVASPSFDSTKVYHELQNRLSNGADEPADTCWQGFFGHLHGYGSTYYSYLFDRVLAERVWRVVFAGGLGGAGLDRGNGERLKERLLKWGGSRDPWRCISDALGDGRLAGGDESAMSLVGSWGIRDERNK
jgi:mitochondrial intermediate peptidase